MRLPGLAEQVDVAPADVFPYGPSYESQGFGTCGVLCFAKKIHRWGTPNQSSGRHMLLPMHSQSPATLVDPDDAILLPDLYWGNYRLVFAQGIRLKSKPIQPLLTVGITLRDLSPSIAVKAPSALSF